MTTDWLEVMTPSATLPQLAHWGSDPLIPGMRIDLSSRETLGVGRSARDELRAGSFGDDKHYFRLTRNKGAWTIRGPNTTLVNAKPLGNNVARKIAPGDVIDGGALAFKLMRGEVDPLLGLAWRAGDMHVAFPLAFPRVRRFRGIALDGPRFCGLVVEHDEAFTDDERGEIVRAWSNAVVIEVPDVDGPSLRQLLDRSRAQGVQLDPAFLAEICGAIDEPITSIDDVAINFDGTVRSFSLQKASMAAPGARLKRMLETMQKQVGEERAGQEALAVLVRELFPAEAKRDLAITEEALMLPSDEWATRVP